MAYNFLIFLQVVTVIALAIESIYVFVNWKSKAHSNLFMYCFSVFIANAIYLGEMLATNLDEAAALGRMGYIGRVWIPVAFLAIIVDFCEIKFPRWIMHAMLVVQAVFLGIVLTSKYHTIYYSDKRVFVETGIFPHKEFVPAPLHTIYFIYIGTYAILGLFLIIRSMIRDRKKSKAKFYPLLLCSIFAMIITFVLYAFHIPGGYDIQALGYAVAAIMMGIGIFSYNLMDNLSIVKDYIMDTISDGVMATDYTGKVIYYNPQIMDILPQCRLMPGVALATIKRHLAEASIIEQDGKFYEASCTPLYKGEDISGLLYILTDVTSRHQHMIELQEQKDIAEEANASKSRFLSMVSHEIRTPMNSVIGMSEILLRDGDNLNDKQRQYLKNINLSGDSLVSMVNDLLDQSKIEAGKMELVLESYELRPMLEDIRLLIENRIGDKPVDLIIEVDEKIPPTLTGDALRIRQILINLLNNAVKFTEKGFIKLAIESIADGPWGHKLTFTISDSGQGIKQEDLQMLGEAFAQVDTQKNHKKEGTGLGLTISKNLIAIMGGQLDVESEYGNGSKFFFTIIQEEGQPIGNSIDEEEAAKLNFTAPSARVLIVDDNELNLIIASEMLSPLNMDCKVAMSGEQALAMITPGSYDIIFMDYMMPGMDGLETSKKLREKGMVDRYYRELPIVALTGDASSETEELFRREGINDVTYKPIEMNKIKAILLRWLPSDKIVR